MIKLLRTFMGLFGVLLVVASAFRVLGWIYGAISPEPLPYSENQRQAVAQISTEVQAWCSTLPLDHKSAVFGNLAHDPFGFVGNPIRDALWRSGKFDLAPRSFWERLRARMNWTVPVWHTGDPLLVYGRSRAADLAIGGAVLGFADDPKPSLQVHLDVVDTATGHTVASRDFLLQPSALRRLIEPPVSSTAPDRRAVLLWAGLVLLTPLLLLPFSRSLLVEGSNPAILLTLFGLVALDVVSGYALYAGQYAGWLGAALVLGLVAVCFALNLKYLTFLKEIAL